MNHFKGFGKYMQYKKGGGVEIGGGKEEGEGKEFQA